MGVTSRRRKHSFAFRAPRPRPAAETARVDFDLNVRPLRWVRTMKQRFPIDPSLWPRSNNRVGNMEGIQLSMK